MSERGTTEAGRSSGRIGIFRRVAVERYTQPLESDLPEMLAPLNGSLFVTALVLLCTAIALLFVV